MESREKAILLLSGGLDSTVAAFIAAERYDCIQALSFDYGQRASRRELGAAYRLANSLEIPHRTVFLPFFRQMDAGALTEVRGDLPTPTLEALDDPVAAQKTAEAVWVPNRNGAMIAVGAAFAEAAPAAVLVVGFNAEEAATFPDNSAEFVATTNAALAYSTRNHVRVEAPTLTWSKSEIVARAMREDWPLEWVWSCYHDEQSDRKPCGRCESCLRFERAIDEAGAGARQWLEARRSSSKSKPKA
ncbi:MAG: 7-cyano-7-deazaguanine synthase QueC [Planctomycetota bacterium]